MSEHCLQHAYSLHHSLCASLLLAYQGLFGYFTSLTKDLPSTHRMELGRRRQALSELALGYESLPLSWLDDLPLAVQGLTLTQQNIWDLDAFFDHG